MSVGNDVLEEILSRVRTILIATSGNVESPFEQHSRAHDLETLNARELDNGYSAVYDEGFEDKRKVLNKFTFTRPLVLSITYQSFSTGSGDKTSDLQAIVLQNEEDIINDLRLRALTGVQGRILEVESAIIEAFRTPADSFLRNEIVLQVFYEL